MARIGQPQRLRSDNKYEDFLKFVSLGSSFDIFRNFFIELKVICKIPVGENHIICEELSLNSFITLLDRITTKAAKLKDSNTQPYARTETLSRYFVHSHYTIFLQLNLFLLPQLELKLSWSP